MIDVISNTELLKHKAIMVRLQRSKLNRNKTDKALSKEISDLKGVTEAGACRVNKSLFSKAATDGYMEVYNKASKYFYRTTLPWDERGYRLLAIEIYEEFTTTMKSFTKQYRERVGNFVDNVGTSIEESKGILQGAFNESDYQFVSSNGTIDRGMLEEQFRLEVEFEPVTTGDDLRANLTDSDRAIIAADIDAKALVKFGKSQEHIVTKLIECVAAIQDNATRDFKGSKDTLIGNLEDLVDLIPKMNIAGDDAINQLAAQAKLKLTSWDTQTLRDDPAKGRDVSKQADAILAAAKGLL